MNHIMSPSRIHARVDLTRAQMQLVIAEVSERVNERADERLHHTWKTAQALRDTAQLFDELIVAMNANTGIENTGGVQVVAMYRTAECLAAIIEPFSSIFEKFIEEHDAMVEQKVRLSVEKFISWARALPSTLRPFWLAYVKDYETGLEAAAQEIQELADEWGAVDADGIDSAA